MITDKDIEKLKSIFATKDDLKPFATKEDLTRFATKEDLTRFATKEDLEKQDIRTGNSFIVVQKQINSLENRFDNLENRFDNLENQFTNLKDEVLRIEDHIIKEIKSMRLDLQSSVSHRRELNDHETRITKIENKLSLA